MMQTILPAILLIGVLSSCKSSETGKTATTIPVATVPALSAPTAPGITSPPSLATIATAKSLGKLEALVFAKDAKTQDQLVGYLEELAKRIDGAMEIRVVDRLKEYSLAKKYRVANDNTIVIATKASSETLHLENNGDLPRLDGLVGRRLWLISRRERKAVFLFTSPAGPMRTLISGHSISESRASESNSIDAASGAGPAADDILVVIDRGGTETKAWTALLTSHLQAGGSALVALEPELGRSLGEAEAILGIGFDTTLIADDKSFLRRKKSRADHHVLVTKAIENHPAVYNAWTATAYPDSAQTVFKTAGSLRISTPPDGENLAVVRSMPSAFADSNGNGAKDRGETVGQKALVATFERRVGSRRSRVVVYADSFWLRDHGGRNGEFLMHNYMFTDSLAWIRSVEGLKKDETQIAATPGQDLVTYPLRSSKPTSDKPPVALWNEDPAGITMLACHRVKVEVKDGHLRASVIKRNYEPDMTPSFKESGAKLLAHWAAPVPMLNLGTFTEEGLKEFELIISADVEISWGDKTRTLSLGPTAYGSENQYLIDPKTRQVYLFKRSDLELCYPDYGDGF
jgi:hypothetical protein